jgi:hypothetical protein
LSISDIFDFFQFWHYSLYRYEDGVVAGMLSKKSIGDINEPEFTDPTLSQHPIVFAE